jgi:hypothetical protein
MTRTGLTSRICCMALMAAFSGNAAFAATSLAPHRAFYALEPERLGDKSGISAISGKMAYEIVGDACEGYAVNYRVANRFIQGEGSPQTTDLQFNSFESGDGTEIDMRQKQFMNGQLDNESRVKAKKPAGAAGEGELQGKETSTFKLDANVIFPTTFQIQLLEDAQKGMSRSTGFVFEGSDKDKVLRAVSFIGAKKPAKPLGGVAPDEQLNQLNKLSSWPVTVSYYRLDSQGDEPPSYSASFTMLENGVSTDLVMDYGDYALKGTLEKIELLTPSECK